ncbi:MAG: SEC-independent protein translocase [Verrucomicrobiales bacterium]|nr:SEC-independent protein translocase [Verrucomicrobiales bacterium]
MPHQDTLPKADIQGSDDCRRMVNAFYEKVREDELLAPVFDDVARVDWNTHLPLLQSFWEKLLFQSGGYRGQPLAKHLMLPVGRQHFARWLSLFIATVDELFDGPKANEAKNYARSIADTFQQRMNLFGPGELKFPGIFGD